MFFGSRLFVFNPDRQGKGSGFRGIRKFKRMTPEGAFKGLG